MERAAPSSTRDKPVSTRHDLNNLQGLSFANCVGCSASAVKADEELEPPTELNRNRPRVERIDSVVLPESIVRIVREYLPRRIGAYVEEAFSGVQPITLGLSQVSNVHYCRYGAIGWLQTKDQWDPSSLCADKLFDIKDEEGCLRFLRERNPNFCPVVINVLDVQLIRTGKGFRKALIDLRKTVIALQEHLRSVKFVVISVPFASCCFSLQDIINDATGFVERIDRQQALAMILDDLEACWEINGKLNIYLLFAFYFQSSRVPPSKMYLSKLVILLNHPQCRALFKKEAPKMISDKLMWICKVTNSKDFKAIDQTISRLCHAMYLDASDQSFFESGQDERMEHLFCYRDNPFVERIVLSSFEHGRELQLPQPSAPLTDDTPGCALIELFLEGENHLDLTQLNNGYFPNLTYLTVYDGTVSGHLDSGRVPRLKNLLIEPFYPDEETRTRVGFLVRMHCKSLIDTGRPWQLIATVTSGGWSLASYDEPPTSPSNDGNDGSPHSSRPLPLIRELMLVASGPDHSHEWQSRLDGNLCPERSAGEHNGRLLVWAPECVQKITAFGTMNEETYLNLDEEMPGESRILTSLTCYNTDVKLFGAATPLLQSLEVHEGWVTLSGSFPHLKTLSLQSPMLESPWTVDAPSLRTLKCIDVGHGANLSLNPQLLTQLSFLHIVANVNDPESYPNIVIIDSDLGLSQIPHVSFGEGMTESSYFEDCRVNHVPHLTLHLMPFELPECWFKAEWYCEILELNFQLSIPPSMDPRGKPDVVVLPALPHLKILKVKADANCPVLLEKEMPNLTECSVPSPSMLDPYPECPNPECPNRNYFKPQHPYPECANPRCPNLLIPKLKCPKLELLRFTGKLSRREREEYLDRSTYAKFNAQSSIRMVRYDRYNVKHTFDADIAPNESDALSLKGRLGGAD